ncbi:MAG: hypothetical protein ACRDL4_08700 [Thermoleophilaceae bacterium]
MNREAVLLQWERKIEDAERRESGRFVRGEDEDGPPAEPIPLRPSEDATKPLPRRFERPAAASNSPPMPAGEGAERRTITIAGQPSPARRRRSVVEAQMAQPDRIALWAFLLGLFLVVVAAGTAHA